MTVRLRILGPVEAEIDGRPVELGHARQRCVLAALLVDANRPVPQDRLIDRVWAQCPPRDARGALYSYLSRLRALLAAGDVEIGRHPAGYVLRCPADAVDLHRFTGLTQRARAATDPAAALAVLEEALGLWRGEALSGLDTAWAERTRGTLAQRRLAAALDRNDLALARGRHGELLPELVGAAERYPLDERLAGQLMLARYRGGRQAGALDGFLRLREHLAGELGTDPGAPLQELYRRILRADPALLATPDPTGDPVPDPTGEPTGDPAGGPGPAPTRPVPRQLPARPVLFTGRGTELAALDKVMSAAGGPAGPVVISAVGGVGGVGKTWLAIEWAYRNLDRFPDGQLHGDLRGFDPAGEPAAPATVLRGFLDALGLAPGAIPAGTDAMAARYRSLVAGRRMLILLDNARDAAGVVPLLPGTGGCAVLVTSRRQLPGLVVGHGAQPVPLDVLPDGDARDLLAALVGAERAAGEPDAVEALLGYCAGLPLALRIVAARAVLNPQTPLADLAADLRAASGRLDGLDAGELTASVRAVLSWSLPVLSAAAQRAFRLLALAPGPDLALGAIAALLGTGVAAARRQVGELAEAHLVGEPVAGRYRMHDLVRLYAAERAAAEEPPAERSAAVRRLLDFYIGTAGRADRVLAPYRDRLLPPRGPVDEFAGERAALDWFTAEHPVFLPAIRLAAAAGLPVAAWELTWAVGTFLDRQGHWDEWIGAQHVALAAVEAPAGMRDCDPAVRAWLHRGLARAHTRKHQHDLARTHAEAALVLFTDLDMPGGQMRVNEDLGLLALRAHEYEEALRHAERAVALSRATGERGDLAGALNSLGWITALLGRHEEALAHCERALALFGEMGDRHRGAAAWDSLGYIHHQAGRYDRSVACYREAVDAFRSFGNRNQEASTLARLADVQEAAGDAAGATASRVRSAAIFEELKVSGIDVVGAS